MSRKERVQQKLEQELNPSHLDVVDFSHQHSGRAGTESHFTVTIVSSDFESVRTVQRHRKIYSALATELNEGLHALQIHAYTETEMKTANIAPPPRCKGG
jgi:BolA family transcriptional regulator, general stress-responsive regulator